jgi:hypothetical protein
MTVVYSGWRKNAETCSVIVMWEKTHIVLHMNIVALLQNIMTLTLKSTIFKMVRLYEYFILKMYLCAQSINRMVRTSDFSKHQNELAWQSDKKATKKISSGPKYKEERTWFKIYMITLSQCPKNSIGHFGIVSRIINSKDHSSCNDTLDAERSELWNDQCCPCKCKGTENIQKSNLRIYYF